MKTIVCLCLTALSVAAADLPEPVLPASVGVNIHFTRGHEHDLDLIAAAGFKFIRMDFGWGGIERKKDAYDWTAYDELTANLEKRGLRGLYIFDYSNPLYEETVATKNPISGKEHKDTASPQHSESVAAFARWAAAGARHFQGRRVIWEIWNEPNITFWKPKPDVLQYNALALATAKAVREADSGATIVGPATSEFPWQFLESFLASGVLEYLDAVSVHPYRSRSKPPETASEDFKKLRALIERHAPAAKKTMPILSGEWGYSSHTKGVTLETQAAFIVRQQLSNLLNGIPLSIWYDWKNDGPDANENEHNFGTVTPDLQPKPAYVALQTLTRQLNGFRIERRLETGDEKDFVLLCAESSGKQMLAAWTLADAHVASLDVGLSGASKVSIVTGNGQPETPKTEGTKLILELTTAPKYVSLSGVKLLK